MGDNMGNDTRIPAFIFTKDRACQLQLLLTSMQKHAPGVFIPYILCKASTRDFLKGYEQVCSEHIVPDIKWVSERESIKQEFLLAMHWAATRGFMGIFTDDCVFHRKLELSSQEIREAFDEETLCFSLRLGLNTVVQDYTTGRLQPELDKETQIYAREIYPTSRVWISWDWLSYNWTDNYGYPMAMDGHIYPTSLLIPMTKALSFDCFRSWEGVLSGQAHRSTIQQHRMASPLHSVLINVPTNSIQDPPIPSGQMFPVSTTELNERFLRGERIDLSAFDFSNVRSAHQEYPLRFRLK